MTTKDFIASRISEIVTSKVGARPGSKAVSAIAAAAERSDGADEIAFEVCSIICREEGVALDAMELARAVRPVMRRERLHGDRRADRTAEVCAAYLLSVGGSNKGVGDTLKKIAAAAFAPAPGVRKMNPRPIKHGDVCRACSQSNPANISFLRYQAKGVGTHASLKNQMAEIMALVSDRIRSIGFPGDTAVSASVVVHRGCCRVHGSEERRDGDGVAELPGILVTVDFGSGVVIEDEYEVGL